MEFNPVTTRWSIQMYRLHDNLASGNAYKVRLILSQLGIPFERIAYDTDRGETRTVEFLKKNPNGKIPVLDLGMRLGEGSGAAVAALVFRAAVACHTGMATFAEAAVSGHE